MKIVFIGNFNIFIWKFAKYYIEQKNFEVILINRDSRNLINHDFSFLTTYNLPNHKLISKVYNIRRLIKKIDPDVVHTFYMSRDSIAPLLFFKRKFKYVVSIFGSDIYHDLNSNNKRVLKKWVLQRADSVTFNSFQMKTDLLKLFKVIDAKKLIPIIWGVEYERLKNVSNDQISALRKKLGLANEKVMLSYRMPGEIYNTELILKTIPYIIEKIPKFKLIMVLGKKKLKDVQAYVDYLKSERLESYVIFIEEYLPVDKLKVFLNLSDAIISIPVTDQFAQSTIESLAANTILILSDLEVYKEVLLEGENAFYVDPADLDSMSKKIIYALNLSPEKRQQIITNNYKLVRSKFSFEEQLEKMIELYK